MIVDLFAGPGGWDEALAQLGHRDVTGVESDELACATATAAGHERLQADVRELRGAHLGARGLVASPPCQPFARPGPGLGRRRLDDLVAAVQQVAAGADVETVGAELGERNALMLEPLVHIRRGRPTWVALEQVPAALPVWQAYARAMAGWGYRVDTMVLKAEQYGVPQIRRRAFLIARQDRPVAFPAPTHSRLHQRDVTRLDPGVRPWVPMADALGWGWGEPDPRAAVAAVVRERASVPSGTPYDPCWPCDRPAPTITGDERVTMPGGNINAVNGVTKSRNDAVHLYPAEAGVLQTFPADYPWAGARYLQHRQVGNAVPPRLARAVLENLVP